MSIEATSGYKLLPPHSYKLEPHHLNSMWITLARKKMFCNPLKLKHYLHSEPDFLGKSNLKGTVWSTAHKSQLMRRKYKISSNWSLMTCYFVMLISIDMYFSIFTWILLLSDLALSSLCWSTYNHNCFGGWLCTCYTIILCEVKLSECYLEKRSLISSH